MHTRQTFGSQEVNANNIPKKHYEGDNLKSNQTLLSLQQYIKHQFPNSFKFKTKTTEENIL